jgi:hypothetical protein
MTASLDANTALMENNVQTLHSTITAVKPLAHCIPFSDSPLGVCYAFVYAPAGGAADVVVDDVLRHAGLPGRGQPQGALGLQARVSVCGGPCFTVAAARAQTAEVDAWLLANPNTTAVALLFDSLNTTNGLAYTVQFNATAM